jgi:hypothetical protein
LLEAFCCHVLQCVGCGSLDVVERLEIISSWSSREEKKIHTATNMTSTRSAESLQGSWTSKTASQATHCNRAHGRDEETPNWTVTQSWPPVTTHSVLGSHLPYLQWLSSKSGTTFFEGTSETKTNLQLMWVVVPRFSI